MIPTRFFVGTGNTIPGDVGALQRSRDGGKTWEYAALPQLPNFNRVLVGESSRRSGCHRRSDDIWLRLSERRRR